MVYRKDLFNTKTESTNEEGISDVEEAWRQKRQEERVNGIQNIVRESENSERTTLKFARRIQLSPECYRR